jgi:RNA polymerase sigma-70 factor, ECF subfamily
MFTTAMRVKPQTDKLPPSWERSDEELVIAFRGGDDSAFAVVFDRYRDRVTGYCWRMLRNGAEAEEVCLESFCRIVEGAWRPGGKFKAFLFTVAHRLCLDKIRKRQRGSRFLSAWKTRPRQGAYSPEDVAVQDERVRRLDEALAELPEDHRACLLLYYGQELSSREVAEALGWTDQQVRSRLSYSRKKLRSVLLPAEEAGR